MVSRSSTNHFFFGKCKNVVEDEYIFFLITMYNSLPISFEMAWNLNGCYTWECARNGEQWVVHERIVTRVHQQQRHINLPHREKNKSHEQDDTTWISLELFTREQSYLTHIMNVMNTALLLVVLLQRVVSMEFSRKQMDNML